MHHRRFAALPLAVALVLGTAAATMGKEQEARASLVTLLPRDGTPGSVIDVEWTVYFIRDGQPFGSEGMFIELTGPTGAVTRATAVQDTDWSKPYRASVVVPAGGIAKVQLGMRGAGDIYGDIYFDRIGQIFAGLPAVTAPPRLAVEAAVEPAPAGNATASAATAPATAPGPDGRLAILVALAAGIVLLLPMALRRRTRAARVA
jgi:hypothetical protein